MPESATPRQRFLDNYSAAYEKLTAPFRNIVAKGHDRAELKNIPHGAPESAHSDLDWDFWKECPKEGVVMHDGDFTYYIRGDSVQDDWHSTKDPADPVSGVRSVTPTTYFALRKDAGREKYVITEHAADSKSLEHGRFSTNVFVRVHAEAAFDMFSTPGKLLLSQEDCRIDGVRELDSPAGKLIAVEFTGLSKKFWYKRGRAVFDPARSWAITESELHEDFTAPHERTMLCKVEYGDWNTRDLVFPKKVERVMVYASAGKATQARHELVTFTSAIPDAVPERQFELSAYGLPEIPYETPKSRYHVQFWVALVALLGLASAFGWRFFRRRRAGAE